MTIRPAYAAPTYAGAGYPSQGFMGAGCAAPTYAAPMNFGGNYAVQAYMADFAKIVHIKVLFASPKVSFQTTF